MYGYYFDEFLVKQQPTDNIMIALVMVGSQYGI